MKDFEERAGEIYKKLKSAEQNVVGKDDFVDALK